MIPRVTFNPDTFHPGAEQTILIGGSYGGYISGSDHHGGRCYSAEVEIRGERWRKWFDVSKNPSDHAAVTSWVRELVANYYTVRDLYISRAVKVAREAEDSKAAWQVER